MQLSEHSVVCTRSVELLFIIIFFLLIPPPPTSTLFPYTTLFRSILASLLVRLVVLLPFQLLRLSLATPSRWTPLAITGVVEIDRKSGSAGMPRPISYAVFCLKKKSNQRRLVRG